MANRIARLLRRRPSVPDRSAVTAPAIAGGAWALDDAAIGPPLLLPAMIFRQVLFDPTEITPAWLRPRPAQAPPPAPAPASAATTTNDATATATATNAPAATEDAPPAKRTRRPKAEGSPARATRSATPKPTRSARSSKAKPKAAD